MQNKQELKINIEKRKQLKKFFQSYERLQNIYNSMKALKISDEIIFKLTTCGKIRLILINDLEIFLIHADMGNYLYVGKEDLVKIMKFLLSSKRLQKQMKKYERLKLKVLSKEQEKETLSLQELLIKNLPGGELKNDYKI